jgi:hypothetical protein
MRLTFVNLTSEPIFISRPLSSRGLCRSSQFHDDAVEEIGTIDASATKDEHFEGHWNGALFLKSLQPLPQEDVEPGASKEWLINPESILVRISMALGASWQVVDVSRESPLRIYCSRVCRVAFGLTLA